jgi:hypothetical protein
MTELLNAPGMRVWNQIAPVIAGLSWIWLTVLLWRGGFTDLFERLRGRARSGGSRINALTMIPFRALMLTAAAGLGAAATVFGLWIQGAVLLTLIDVVRNGG